MILNNYVVTGGLLRSNGDQAQVGDSVRLYLDTVANPNVPSEMIGVIENPIAPVNCGQDFAYKIQYEGDFFLKPVDVLNSEVLDCCALLDETTLKIVAQDLTQDEIDQTLENLGANEANGVLQLDEDGLIDSANIPEEYATETEVREDAGNKSGLMVTATADDNGTPVAVTIKRKTKSRNYFIQAPTAEASSSKCEITISGSAAEWAGDDTVGYAEPGSLYTRITVIHAAELSGTRVTKVMVFYRGFNAGVSGEVDDLILGPSPQPDVPSFNFTSGVNPSLKITCANKTGVSTRIILVIESY